MYVTPEAWGIGAGRALMQAARDALLDLEFRDAVLWVLEANGRARRFYERAGWRPDGVTRTDDYGGVELPAVRYVQSLNRDEA
ncbi:MAG: GNAT family N-acetyltransferase [Chloroflexota bacterium]|nr:GNAT family N-acetyltransferase [Chloroflexota bacterium]